MNKVKKTQKQSIKNFCQNLFHAKNLESELIIKILKSKTLYLKKKFELKSNSLKYSGIQYLRKKIGAFGILYKVYKQVYQLKFLNWWRIDNFL